MISFSDYPEQGNSREESDSQLSSMQPQERIAYFIEELKSNDALGCERAALALGEAGRHAVPALAAALSDPNRNSRYWAAVALGKIGQEARDAVPALVATLRDPDGEVRYFAVEALGNIGPDARHAVPALVVALSDLDIAVRTTAADILSKISPDA